MGRVSGWGPGTISCAGQNLLGRAVMISRAFIIHRCGFLQPLRWYILHLSHVQFCLALWRGLWRPSAAVVASPTVTTKWYWRRQVASFKLVQFIALVVADASLSSMLIVLWIPDMWYHNGRLHLRFSSSAGGSNTTLYFFFVRSMLIIFFGRGTMHDHGVSAVFCSGRLLMLASLRIAVYSPILVSIISSAMYAHLGHSSPILQYC